MDLFKDLIWDNLVEAAMIKLFVAFPFLNFWPVNAMIRYIVLELTDGLYIAIDQYIDTAMIPLKNEALKKEFGHEQVKLKIIAGGNGIDSKEFKDARIKSRDRLRDFLRTGAA